jgi:hypothetical protein
MESDPSGAVLIARGRWVQPSDSNQQEPVGPPPASNESSRPEPACRERRLSGKPVWSPNAASVGSYCAIAISAGTASSSCSKTPLRRSVKSWACFGMFPRSTHLVRLTSCLADERPLSRGSGQILDWPACATGARKVSAGRSRPAPEGTARGGYAAINDLQYARAQAARRVRRCSTRSARGCRR